MNVFKVVVAVLVGVLLIAVVAVVAGGREGGLLNVKATDVAQEEAVAVTDVAGAAELAALTADSDESVEVVQSAADATDATDADGGSADDADAEIAEECDGENESDETDESHGQGNSQYDAERDDQIDVTGTVAADLVAGGHLLVEGSDGETFEVGIGPDYMQNQGFWLKEGETVAMTGYWEDDEFKAMTITRESDGETIVLRDSTGRPAWSGQGRRKNADTH